MLHELVYVIAVIGAYDSFGVGRGTFSLAKTKHLGIVVG